MKNNEFTDLCSCDQSLSLIEQINRVSRKIVTVPEFQTVYEYKMFLNELLKELK